MKYQLNKELEGKVKDGLSSEFRKIVEDYIEEKEEELQAGILSGLSEDRSKTIYSKRDLDIYELELLKEFKEIPNRIITRISNQTDISVEDDH